MKLTRTIRREVVLLCLPLAFILAFAFLFQIWNSPSGRLVGTWKTSDPTSTTLTTFKANGEYELVTTGSGVGSLLVFKGRYSASGNTFRHFDFKRYTRRGGRDILFTPCTDSFDCVIAQDIDTFDKEMSNRKYFWTIVEADWERGILKVRSPDFGQHKGTINTWTRQ